MATYFGTITRKDKDETGNIAISIDDCVTLLLSSEIERQPNKEEQLKQLYNSCFVGDHVEYEYEYASTVLNGSLLKNITAETGIVTSEVVTSNPISQIPMVKDTGILDYHIVLLKNARWGDAILTPLNTFPDVVSISSGQNLLKSVIKPSYLPTVLRFCNLRPGQNIGVSRYTNSGNGFNYGDSDLSKYAYVIREFTR